MKTRIRCMPTLFALAVFAAFTLGGCALAPLVGLQEEVDFAEGKGIEGVAKAIDLYCVTETHNVAKRKQRLEKLNAMTIRGNMTPLDCDSDGNPDF